MKYATLHLPDQLGISIYMVPDNRFEPAHEIVLRASSESVLLGYLKSMLEVVEGEINRRENE